MVLLQIFIFLFVLSNGLISMSPVPQSISNQTNRSNEEKLSKKRLSNYLLVPLLIPLKNDFATKQQSQQWFLANYFPIIIRDPIREIMTAITSVIQYGPNATLNNLNCRTSRDIKDVEKKELNVTESNDNSVIDLMQFYKFLKKITSKRSRNYLNLKRKLTTDKNYENIEKMKLNLKDKIPAMFSGGDKGDKKIWHKDNSGNGIFIHKIRVRQGGVAIAGPNGIATAGSGGTAIVGPNGWALTHPNSVAIAGPGTEVLAIDSKYDLRQLAEEILKLNGSLPRALRSKVVAKGPVIYRNTENSIE